MIKTTCYNNVMTISILSNYNPVSKAKYCSVI